ncbi:homoserine kinase [Altererythrobacter lutimaris]|uniref:Homoserine kinase n=1 Tax=Altererythrobacter lutimaris TaxID=2743979 RepID=A0A850HAJ1_9SPHN|nr:homoserine kinase [Altererythrobacter lutimaris]
MAVYTHLGAEELAKLIAHYDVGELVSAKGIAEGVSNSNWLIETTGGNEPGTRFILTMYERRIELRDLPFFLSLLDHLADKGCPVPRTIHDNNSAASRLIDGKAVALIEYLPGVSVDHPTPAQARSVGAALAKNHLAVADFPETRWNDLGLVGWGETFDKCGMDGLASIDPRLPELIQTQMQSFVGNWPIGLPNGVVHCDLFPDNVLMLGDEVSGLIDFYFAASDFFAYDLAVTHAAWCFEREGQMFRPDISESLLAGYQSVRGLSEKERKALPILARGACMRFIASRAEDWLNAPDDALVARKDPMDFVNRLDFYVEAGTRVFAREP